MQDAIERAYGCLWQYLGDDKMAHEARRHLFEVMDRSAQKRGIEFARARYGQPSEAQLMAATDRAFGDTP